VSALKSKTITTPLAKGQIWKLKDAGFVTIVALGKLLVHFRLTPTINGRGTPMRPGGAVRTERQSVLQEFLRKSGGELLSAVDQK